MRIDQIHLKNFRCYENISIDFHPKSNLFVGINGTGKTAILEAIRIAIGSLFLNVDKHKDRISSPGIQQDDVRLAHLEQQFPVVITSTGTLNNFSSENNQPLTITWERSLETKGGTTRYINAKEMKSFSATMQDNIRKSNQGVTIPLIAYYSTDRFKKEKKDVGFEADGSRLRGYYNALDSSTNIKFFLNLYFTETIAELQNKKTSEMLAAVNAAVMECIPNCEHIIFDVKKRELLITLKDTHEKLPFHVLSDGVRSMLSMVMEIAFRCYLLNPHLKENAALRTTGIVLIDEIDLHLHPKWQKQVFNNLRNAFPELQFITTTHAPLVIGSLNEGNIFSIKENQTYSFPLQYGRDANYILNEMGTSEMDKTLKEHLTDYFLLIEKGHGTEDEAMQIRAQLEEQLGKDHTELQRADMMLSFF